MAATLDDAEKGKCLQWFGQSRLPVTKRVALIRNDRKQLIAGCGGIRRCAQQGRCTTLHKHASSTRRPRLSTGVVWGGARAHLRRNQSTPDTWRLRLQLVDSGFSLGCVSSSRLSLNHTEYNMSASEHHLPRIDVIAGTQH